MRSPGQKVKIRTGAIEVEGVRLAYRECGPATADVPVIALHGMVSGAATWDGVAAELARRGRRVIALDLRGHGRSSRPGRYALSAMRDDVIGFLDQRGIDRFDLLGHSLGGYVACLVAIRRPSQVGRLVLEDTPFPPSRTAGQTVNQAEKETPSVPGRGALLVRNLFILSRIRQFDVRMANPVIAELRTPDPQWWADLTTITAQTMVISGGPTSHLPVEPQRRVAAAIPDARLVIVDGAGHRVHSTRTDEFLDVVLPFLTDPDAT